MKKTYFKTFACNGFKVLRYMAVLLIVFQISAGHTSAKTNPMAIERVIAFKRAAQLNNGISISWLEQTWNNNALKARPVNASDFVLLKKLGFKSIRLPVAFEYYYTQKMALSKVFTQVDWVLNQCKMQGLKLIIDYHYGKIDDNNYILATNTAASLWKQISLHYLKEDPNQLMYEIYNEPPPMNPQLWKDAAYNICTAIRQIDKSKTLLIGASNYNSIYELSRFVRLADENIIYSFHFYEPFIFTHQGAEWVGNQVATTGVPFPYDGKKIPQLNFKAKGTWGETNYYKYNKDGNAQALFDKLSIVNNWAQKYDVPIICSEYGVYNKYADPDSRCNYIKTMRTTLKSLKIPGILWDYNTNFSIFAGKPSIASLPLCMHEALLNK